MKTTKEQINTLRAKDQSSEQLAKLVAYAIITVITIGGAWYCVKGAIMQISANW